MAQKDYGVMRARSMNVRYSKPTRTWAGHGSGAVCDLCGERIDADQIEYEVELADDERTPVLNLHLTCFEVWTNSQSED